MSRVGLSAVFLNNAFGMTCLGGDKGWARKDDVNSGVYQWICNKYGVSPTDAMMVEDTHENLIGAHAIDMQTVHIGWGKPKLERHIDWNFEKTSQFLRHTLVHGVAQPQRMVRKFG
jgi:phosphoglycolate phosphatase-like HAD superfamily hydrolase